MNRMSYTLGIITLALFAFVSGCRTVDSVERAEPRATPTYVDLARVETGSGLHNRVRVISMKEATVGGDLLKVEAELENLTQVTQRFSYAFEWFDHNGMRVREMQWRSMTLRGRQRSVVSAVANSPDAVDFRLQLMRSRP